MGRAWILVLDAHFHARECQRDAVSSGNEGGKGKEAGLPMRTGDHMLILQALPSVILWEIGEVLNGT